MNQVKIALQALVEKNNEANLETAEQFKEANKVTPNEAALEEYAKAYAAGAANAQTKLDGGKEHQFPSCTYIDNKYTRDKGGVADLWWVKVKGGEAWVQKQAAAKNSSWEAMSPKCKTVKEAWDAMVQLELLGVKKLEIVLWQVVQCDEDGVQYGKHAVTVDAVAHVDNIVMGVNDSNTQMVAVEEQE